MESLGASLGMKFHHVGVAVKSIDDALAYYRDIFGFEQISDSIDVEPEDVRVCFIRAEPGVLIELVEGIGESSPVREILDRFTAGAYHICYQVDDLDHAIGELRAHRCRPFRRFEVDTPGPSRFAFLLTPDRQLFELCEAPEAVGKES
jgi:methylmalonyl-CoA/ethylmalonyl-CoA epimerase